MLIQKPFYFWIQRLLYRASHVALVFLLVFLPFQKKFYATESEFSKQITPDFFSGDLVVFLLVLIVFLQAPKTFARKLVTKPARWLVLYCITAFFSIVLSSSDRYFLQYIRLLQFSMMVFLFCAIEYIVAHHRIRQLVKGLAWAIVLTAGVQCVIATMQYFSQTALEGHKIGEASLSWFCFSNPGKQRWVFDQIAHFQLSSNVLCRATGLFSHPNLFGGFLFFSLLNASYLYVIHQKKWIKWSLTPIIFMHFFALSISFCGTAIIACVIGMVIWTFIQYFWMKDVFYRKEVKKVGFIFLLSGVICLALFYQQFFNQMVQHVDGERGAYQMVLQMMKENLWLGAGFNHFQLCNDPIQLGKAYSMYLLIALETGIMGLVFFGAFLFCILKKAVTKLFLQEQALFLSIVIGFLWIGCCDCYLMEQMYGKYLFFIPLALFNAAIQKTNALQPERSLQKRIFLPRS